MARTSVNSLNSWPGGGGMDWGVKPRGYHNYVFSFSEAYTGLKKRILRSNTLSPVQESMSLIN